MPPAPNRRPSRRSSRARSFSRPAWYSWLSLLLALLCSIALYEGGPRIEQERERWAAEIPSILKALPQPEPHSHARFDNLGAVGPACLKMETYGTADEEKHACGLSTLFSKEKECVVVSIG